MASQITSMTDEEFVQEMQKRWQVFHKYHPRQAKVALARLQSSSPLFSAKTRLGFERAIVELLETENNPQVFDFLQGDDWKKTRDLIVFANLLP